VVEILVFPDGRLQWGGRRVRCALGRGGVRADKREGDGATPVGRFPLRRVFYRADRVPPPATGLPVQTIAPDLGWCDDPAHADYNRMVGLPFAASHERLWRDDALYDLLAVIGYNDEPVAPGLGSAIFLHVAKPSARPSPAGGRGERASGPDFAPTEGCVALVLAELSDLLAACGPGDTIRIEDGPA